MSYKYFYIAIFIKNCQIDDKIKIRKQVSSFRKSLVVTSTSVLRIRPVVSSIFVIVNKFHKSTPTYLTLSHTQSEALSPELICFHWNVSEAHISPFSLRLSDFPKQLAVKIWANISQEGQNSAFKRLLLEADLLLCWVNLLHFAPSKDWSFMQSCQQQHQGPCPQKVNWLGGISTHVPFVLQSDDFLLFKINHFARPI